MAQGLLTGRTIIYAADGVTPLLQGLTDAELRATSLPVNDRVLVSGPFTGRDNEGNVLVTETVPLPGLFGPDESPLAVAAVQVILVNGTNRTISVGLSLSLSETVGGVLLTRSVSSLGISTIAVGGTATATYIPGSINAAPLRQAALSITYLSSAPTSGAVTVLAYAFPTIGSVVAGNGVGQAIASISDNNGNMFKVASNSGGDGTSGLGAMQSANYAFNGTNWDRLRSNTQETLAASIGRSTTMTTADQINHNARSLKIFVNVTVMTSGGLTPTIQGKDGLSAQYYDILVGTKIVAPGLYVFSVDPDIVAVAGVRAQDRVPRNWRVVCAPDTAVSLTYTVSANQLV